MLGLIVACLVLAAEVCCWQMDWNPNTVTRLPGKTLGATSFKAAGETIRSALLKHAHTHSTHRLVDLFHICTHKLRDTHTHVSTNVDYAPLPTCAHTRVSCGCTLLRFHYLPPGVTVTSHPVFARDSLITLTSIFIMITRKLIYLLGGEFLIYPPLTLLSACVCA